MDDAHDFGNGDCLALLKDYTEMPELKKKTEDKSAPSTPVVESAASPAQPSFKQMPKQPPKPVVFSAEIYSDGEGQEEEGSEEKIDLNGNLMNGAPGINLKIRRPIKRN